MKPPPLHDMASVAILGGGCAGLSLAEGLCDAFRDVEVTIFEPRRELIHDRTWCFWRFEKTPYEELAAHEWTTCLVKSPQVETRVDCRTVPYLHLPSRRFYDTVQSRLAAHPRVRLAFGTRVDELREDDSGVHVLSSGDTGTAEDTFTMVFDSRPPEAAVGPHDGATLIQHFVGREVVFDDDRFDPETVTLMDFDIAQDDGLHFMYVLPFSSRRGLIESTFMTPPGDRTPDYDRQLDDYITRRFGGTPARIERTERGRLPMHAGLLAPTASARVWPIGTRSGAARASTGYAFEAIQRDTARVIRALRRGGSRPRPPRSPLMDVLDRIVLTLLAQRPDRGPELFATLFRDAPSASLLRFLSDRASPRDVLAVIRAMPTTLVSRHVLAAPQRCIP